MLVAVEVVAGKGRHTNESGNPKKAPDLVKRAFFSIEITSFLDPIFFSIFGSFEERERSKGKE
jgi:hypothetical protein